VITTPLDAWHEIVAAGDLARLGELLADDVVFHSPVVHTPIRGRDLVTMYLAGAFQVLANPSFRYVREVVSGNDAVLEFETDLDGIHVNGVDMLRWDDDGRLVDLTVMIRPKKAFELVHQRMAELLAAATDR
jgi:ketosteroid isomerase-like protein